jgi:Phage capsid protein
MSDTAFQVQYRREAIAGFEFGQSDLRTSVTTEAVIKGNQAVFVVADSGGASATNRGVNGLIPARSDDLNQFTATLVEWHDLVRRTSFNLFASQGSGSQIMQRTTRAVMNRKTDLDIMASLQTGTNYIGLSGTTMTLAAAIRALTVLGINQVPVQEEDNMYAVISPAAYGYLLQVKEFNNADFQEVKPLVGPVRRFRRWAGFNWIMHPLVPGIGTSSETLFFYHRDAVGHAVDTGGMQALAGYHEEQDYSWARTTGYMGSVLLQNRGVVLMRHDGSAYTATA